MGYMIPARTPSCRRREHLTDPVHAASSPPRRAEHVRILVATPPWSRQPSPKPTSTSAPPRRPRSTTEWPPRGRSTTSQQPHSMKPFKIRIMPRSGHNLLAMLAPLTRAGSAHPQSPRRPPPQARRPDQRSPTQGEAEQHYSPGA
jgi:hypothetical protein